MTARLRHALLVGTFVVMLPASVAAADLNCSDFGTRERAQHEIDSSGRDRHNLDGDADGKACEGNPSTGWIPWPVAGLSLVAGRYIARRTKADYRLVPGIEGVWAYYDFPDDDAVTKVFDRTVPVLLGAGFLALPLVDLVRDDVAPRSFSPAGFWVLTAIVAGIAAYVGTVRWSRHLAMKDSPDRDPGP